MKKFNKGDIVVCETTSESNYRHNPTTILKGTIGENISENPDFVWFKDTPMARGSWSAKIFRLAVDHEIKQFQSGKKIVEPECPFEEGDYVITLNYTKSIEGEGFVEKDKIYQIDGIIKTKDITKSKMYFIEVNGYYYVLGDFRKATAEELKDYETR